MPLEEHVKLSELSEYLAQTYNVTITSSTNLDANVYQISSDSGTKWAVRVFRRPLDDLQLEYSLMQYLKQHNYPVEVSPFPDAVSQYGPNICVMTTQFESGTHPERNRKTFHRLGELLGRLHTIPLPPSHLQRKGGAWHHLSPTGGMEEEIATARAGLIAHRAKIASCTNEQELIDQLLSKLDTIPTVRNVPQALVHPDFVPSNIIENPETGEWTVVDWAGFGIGPRILSLGYLLYVAAARGKLILVDSIMSGYTVHVQLEQAEIDLLETAVWIRPFAIACWDVFHGRQGAAKALEAFKKWCEAARNVAARVREILSCSPRAQTDLEQVERSVESIYS